MASKKITRFATHFLVPIHEDISIGSGDLHPYYRWENLQKDLFTMFGGWTLSPGLYEGEYPDPDPGKSVRDRSKQYAVALEEEQVPELRQYLKTEVAVNFRQKVIYFFNGREVEFVKSAEIPKF